MNSPSPHIIERIVLDVRTPTGGYALQQHLTDWLQGEAIPAIERLCDEVLPGATWLHIDLMELDLGRMRVLDLGLPGVRADLLDQLISQLRSRLLEELSQLNGAGAQVQGNKATSMPLPYNTDDLSMHNRPFAAWLFFLEYGYLPWWSEAFPPSAEWSVFLAEWLTTSGHNRTKLREVLRRSRAAMRRLVGDARHEKAFQGLIAAMSSLSTGWENWRSARGDYEELRPRIPGISPTPREWIEQGKALFWWKVLGDVEKVGKSEVLAKAVIALFPDRVTQRMVGALLGGEVSSYLQKSHDQDKREVNTPDTGRQASLVPRSADDEASKAVVPPQSKFDRPEEPQSKVENSPMQSSHVPPLTETKDALSNIAPANPQNADPPAGQHPDPSKSSQVNTRQPSVVNSNDLPEFPQTLAGSEPANREDIFPIAIGTSPTENNTWYVRWAGVVLVHPYLAPLFTVLGYWQEGDFADEVAQQRAVYLTHYLASGQREVGEEEVVLSKLLCGWPVSGRPALLTEPLTDTECHEADEVLRAVLGHWNESGMTSPDGLRGGFFARDGRVESEENGWRITVDRKAQDILLGRLPWGISLVYAPWHERMIKVEW